MGKIQGGSVGPSHRAPKVIEAEVVADMIADAVDAALAAQSARGASAMSVRSVARAAAIEAAG